MVVPGYISAAQASAAEARPIKVFASRSSTTSGPAAYFVDYVTQELVRALRLRARSSRAACASTRASTRPGKRTRSSVVKSTVTPLDFGFKPSAALVAIDPANGYIRAMVGRPGLRQAAVQPGLAGAAPAGLGDEALRAGGRRREGHGPLHHLLLLAEPGGHSHGTLCGALGRARRRPRRARDGGPGHGDLRQRRLCSPLGRRRTGEHRPGRPCHGYHQPA